MKYIIGTSRRACFLKESNNINKWVNKMVIIHRISKLTRDVYFYQVVDNLFAQQTF